MPCPPSGKVIVDGVNVAKKHQKATRATMQGGIIDKDMPIPVANVALVCPTCGAADPGRVPHRAGRHQGPGLQEVWRRHLMALPAASTTPLDDMPRLRRRYHESVRDALAEQLGPARTRWRSPD